MCCSPFNSQPTANRGGAITDAVYGRPNAELAETPKGAIQLSPLFPGAARLEDQPDGAFASMTILVPQGVLERRFALAHALRALAPGKRLVALAPKDRGGARLRQELESFGCAVEETARRHHRVCCATRPDRLAGLEEAIEAGAPQIPPALGLWTQPGIFSWDRPDPGSLALLRHLPKLVGAGADFGCGIGLLGRAALQGADVTRLDLIDIDRRAIDAARRNVADPRVAFAWADIRTAGEEGHDLDFVITNPPFHDGGVEDTALGESFIRRAADRLKPSGVCWLVANRHLPYDTLIRSLFPRARMIEQADGYKIYEARR